VVWPDTGKNPARGSYLITIREGGRKGVNLSDPKRSLRLEPSVAQWGGGSNKGAGGTLSWAVDGDIYEIGFAPAED